MPLYFRSICGQSIRRPFVISLASLLLLTMQWAATAHVQEECHEHSCIACNVSGEAWVSSGDLQPTTLQLTAQGIETTPVSSAIVCACSSQPIRAPPTV